ncbi:hypothetical protein Ahy_B01g052634 [Arachis hypogaea]|uniref:Uncharacterized protein n=1 Tax=Arachis hypogaea TaxID=3818 RepID=A0A445APZ3_ARAHY|nr:hypothetical protein Ahy_B01g052634 [Arachis hypogaea]
MDFKHIFNIEGEDSDGVVPMIAADIIVRVTTIKGFECRGRPEGRKKRVGDVVDGNESCGANDAVDGGLSWPVVATIVDEHNHELALAMFTYFLPSHRQMSDGNKAQVDSLKAVWDRNFENTWPGNLVGKKKSCVVVTNGDKSMRVAIAKVMPTTTHRLYGWHLEKNCVQRVKETEFCKVFRKAIYAKFEINDFEEYWKASVECLALGSVHA